MRLEKIFTKSVKEKTELNKNDLAMQSGERVFIC